MDTSIYKSQLDEPENKRDFMKCDDGHQTHLIEMGFNRCSSLFEPLVNDLHYLLNNTDDMESIIESINSLCLSIDETVNIEFLLDSGVPDIILQFLKDDPEHILTIFKYIIDFTDAYDDFFIGEIEYLQKLYESQLVNRNLIASIVVSLSFRHPKEMLTFIVTFSKAMVMMIEIPKFIFNILPVLENTLLITSPIYKMVINCISQFFMSNDLDIILMGVKIIKRAIECGNLILMKSFEECQIQYESLLCSDELKKIAAGYEALALTMRLQSSMDCIRKSRYIFQKAEGQIQIVGNAIKKSIIQYIIQYTIFTKSCISKPLLFQLFVLAEHGNFVIQNEAVNCLSIIVQYTKLNVLDFPNLIDTLASHVNVVHKFNFNILSALLTIIGKFEKEEQITEDVIESLSLINFDDIMDTENEKFCQIAEYLMHKITQFTSED